MVFGLRELDDWIGKGTVYQIHLSDGCYSCQEDDDEDAPNERTITWAFFSSSFRFYISKGVFALPNEEKTNGAFWALCFLILVRDLLQMLPFVIHRRSSESSTTIHSRVCSIWHRPINRQEMTLVVATEDGCLYDGSIITHTIRSFTTLPWFLIKMLRHFWFSKCTTAQQQQQATQAFQKETTIEVTGGNGETTVWFGWLASTDAGWRCIEAQTNKKSNKKDGIACRCTSCAKESLWFHPHGDFRYYQSASTIIMTTTCWFDSLSV